MLFFLFVLIGRSHLLLFVFTVVQSAEASGWEHIIFIFEYLSQLFLCRLSVFT
jgi:hypothetical protein